MIQNRIISSNNVIEMDSVMSTGLSLGSRLCKLERTLCINIWRTPFACWLVCMWMEG